MINIFFFLKQNIFIITFTFKFNWLNQLIQTPKSEAFLTFPKTPKSHSFTFTSFSHSFTPKSHARSSLLPLPRYGSHTPNLEEVIASTYELSRYQTHKVCTSTWSIKPWTWQHLHGACILPPSLHNRFSFLSVPNPNLALNRCSLNIAQIPTHSVHNPSPLILLLWKVSESPFLNWFYFC